MTTFILLPFFLYHFPMTEPDTLLIGLKPTGSLSFDKKISVAFEYQNITHLTIELKENQNIWIVFGSFPDRSDIENDPSYSIKYKVGTLPNEFNRLTSLQSLRVAFLGLKTLPESITHIPTLQELDISFNKLVDPQAELKKLMKMSRLLLLKVYGCGFQKEQIQLLEQMNPGLQVYYTKTQFTEESQHKMKNAKP